MVRIPLSGVTASRDDQQVHHTFSSSWCYVSKPLVIPDDFKHVLYTFTYERMHHSALPVVGSAPCLVDFLDFKRELHWGKIQRCSKNPTSFLERGNLNCITNDYFLNCHSIHCPKRVCLRRTLLQVNRCSRDHSITD
jgi:hypothetical protein